MQVATSKPKKDYSIEDIMQLDKKLSLGKKKAGAAAATNDVEMADKSKKIKKSDRKKVQAKRSKRIIKF